MVLSIDSLTGLEGELTPQIDRAREESRSLHVPALLRDLLGKPRADVDRAWNEVLTLPQRRMILRLVVTIRLYKASSRGVRGIEPGRIRLSYFGEPGFKPVAGTRAKL
jgi:hypothetical protein